MAVKNSIQPIVLTSIDSASFSGSYQAVNAAGLAQSCFMIRIINNSNRDITVSYDGTNDHDFVPDADLLQLTFQNNAQPNNNLANIRKGTVVYVKGTAGGTGLVYLAAYYQAQAN